MNEPNDLPQDAPDDIDALEHSSGVSGLGQKILGELETIGGVLTGDPISQAEGEFNWDVGHVREEIEEDLEAHPGGRPVAADEEDDVP